MESRLILVNTLILILVSFSMSLALTPFVRMAAMRLGAVDRPGGRKIHSVPTPRLGGLSIFLAVAVTVVMARGLEWIMGDMILIHYESWLRVVPGACIVFVIGVWDDIHPISAKLKFGFQAAAAALAIWYGLHVQSISLFGHLSIQLGMWGVPITFLWVIGITNAFNLVDGLDGLAAGLAMIAAGANAVFFFLIGDVQHALFLVVLFGAILGFFPYNFHPAKIFLGDSGSLVLGYVLATTAISGQQKSVTTLAVVIPLLLFGLPIVDTLLSMARRFAKGLRPCSSSKGSLKNSLLSTRYMFEADQRHIHHRLLVLGFSHRGTVLLLYAVALGLSGLAFLSVLAQYRNAGIILMIVGIATYLGIRKLGYDEIACFPANTLLRWYEQLKIDRGFSLGLVDAALISLAYWGAFLLKYDGPWETRLVTWYIYAFPIKLTTQIVVFYTLGLYRKVWRAVEVKDLHWAALAVLPANAIWYSLALLNPPPEGTVSFFWIDALLLGVLIVGVRSGYSLLKALNRPPEPTGEAVLIYGAGQQGQRLVRELQDDTTRHWQPVGFLDDNVALHGRTVHDVTVLGGADDLKTIIEDHHIAYLILSPDPIQALSLRRITDICRERHIPILRSEAQLDTSTPKALPVYLNPEPATRFIRQS